MVNYIKNIVEPKRLLLAWQAADSSISRTRWAVGEVTLHEGTYLLNYFSNEEEFGKYNDGTLQNIRELGYVGYPAFHLKQKQHSIGVLEAFMRRMPPRSRSDFSQYQYYFRISETLVVSDFAMLGLTEAKLPSDGFSLVDPLDDDRSQRQLVIEIAGYRHYAGQRVDTLEMLGREIEFQPEPQNPMDGNAIQMLVDGRLIGYVNRLQTTPFHRWIREKRLSAVIERLNGDATRPRAFAFVKVEPLQESIAA